jgi:hypothetical protein
MEKILIGIYDHNTQEQIVREMTEEELFDHSIYIFSDPKKILE